MPHILVANLIWPFKPHTSRALKVLISKRILALAEQDYSSARVVRPGAFAAQKADEAVSRSGVSCSDAEAKRRSTADHVAPDILVDKQAGTP